MCSICINVIKYNCIFSQTMNYNSSRLKFKNTLIARFAATPVEHILNLYFTSEHTFPEHVVF